jgi:hypothetical protein
LGGLPLSADINSYCWVRIHIPCGNASQPSPLEEKTARIIGRFAVKCGYQQLLLGSNPHSLRERFAALSAGSHLLF